MKLFSLGGLLAFSMVGCGNSSTSNDIFLQKSKLAPVIVSNDTLSNYAATLKEIRTVIVAEVVTGDMTVEEILASLN